MGQREAEQRAARRIIEYRLSDTAWLVMLAAPGQSYDDAVNNLERRFGNRLLETRPYARR